MKHRDLLTSIALLATSSLAAHADLRVDQDLGSLDIGSTTPITGDTATGANNVDIYFTDNSSETFNWGNELVFQFTLASDAFVSLTSNTLTGDPDAFLLSGLGTSVEPVTGKQIATGAISFVFLDSVPPATGSFGFLIAGTYYISIESFIGFDGDVTPEDATFDYTLSINTGPATPATSDLGILGDESETFTIDTFGSALESGDTELGLFTFSGELIDENDDANDTLQSELTIGPLPAGEYYIAVGEFNTFFEPGFNVTGAGDEGSGGRFFLNHPNGTNAANLGDGVDEPDVVWYKFGIRPQLGPTPWLVTDDPGPPALDFQTALFKQTVTITNISPFPLPAFRLLLSGLPDGVNVYNAQGEADGRSFLLYNQSLAAGESVELVVEYFQADASGGFEAEFDIELLDAVEMAGSAGGAQLQRIDSLPNGDMLLEFLSTPGDSYTIQYSHNGEDWFGVLPAVTAGANVTQWVDNGPPKTPSHPSTMKSRLYRVVHQSNAR